MMECADSIFPLIRKISEGKWRQMYVKGWEEYDHEVGELTLEERRVIDSNRSKGNIKNNNNKSNIKNRII